MDLRTAGGWGALVLLIACAARPAAGATAPTVTFDEKPLGRAADYDAIKAVTFSPDATRLAFLGIKGDKQFVVRDGQPGPAYDWVVPNSLSGPLNLTRLAFVTQDGNDVAVVVDGTVVGRGYYAVAGDRVHFSADGRHFAYTAHRGSSNQGDTIVVRDGIAGKPYAAADVMPAFSPDGNHLLFVASPAPKKMCLVIDEKEGPLFDAIAEATAGFSPDSKRTAYAAALGGKVVAVVDGKAGTPYDRMLVPPFFSPDSSRSAYVAGNGGQYSLVLDRVEGPKFALFTEGSVAFSPDSKHTAYAARKDKQWVLLRDGKEEGTYDAIAGGSILFSPDSQHLAFVGITGGKRFIILDGKPISRGYSNILWPGPIFSPDSRRLAYAGTREKDLIVVVDDKEGPPCDNVAEVAFSPDSKHLSYRALSNSKAMIVFDGMASSPFDNTTSVAYAADGSHWAYCAAQGDQAHVIVDGSPVGQAYAGWVKGSRPAFDGSNTLNCLMVRGREFLQVRVRISGGPLSSGK